jgi:AcrR family transcriptional regulator
VKTRKTILAQATALFAQQGFAATSLRDIAARAHIEAATVYHYFPSKKDLLLEIFGDFYAALARRYEHIDRTLPRAATLREGLAHFMAHHRDFLDEHRSFASLFFVEGLRTNGPLGKALQGITQEATRHLRVLAGRWRTMPREQVLALFMGVVAINAFFRVAEQYLKDQTGVALSAKKQQEVFTALLGTGKDLEQILGKK